MTLLISELLAVAGFGADGVIGSDVVCQQRRYY